MTNMSAIGATLVKLKVLSEAQWKRATVGDPEPAIIINRLARTPGRWFDPDALDTFALSEYQLRVVREVARGAKLTQLKRELRIGRYLILEPLGQGGMGIVLLAWDLKRERYVALKRVHGASPKLHGRFRREARISARLNHPLICRALSFHVGKKSALLVIEYIRGRNLRSIVLDRKEPLPWQDVCGWAIDVLDALAYAHGQGVVHRDLKPENIMICPQERGPRAKILDMGLAKWKGDPGAPEAASGEHLSDLNLLVGTPNCMAPEQWNSAAPTIPESDIYALGVTLFYALTGELPFQCDSAAQYCLAHTQEPPPRVRDRRPDVPAQLDSLVDRMLTKLARHRGTALEHLWALRQMLSTGPDTAVIEPAELQLVQPTVGATSVSPAFVQIIFREVTAAGETTHRFKKPTRLSFHHQTLARLIPVPGHWSLYPVGAESHVWRNCEPVRDCCRLETGDVIHLGTSEWRVGGIAPLPLAKEISIWPTVEIWFNGQRLTRTRVRSETLIGAGEWCSIRLPDGLGLPANWAVFALTNRGWELGSLTESGFELDGSELGMAFTFDGPGEVEQGGLRFVFESPAEVVSPPKPRESTSPSSIPAAKARTQPIYRSCEELCRSVIAGLRVDSAAAPIPAHGPSLRGLLKRLVKPRNPTEELLQFQNELERAPRDPTVLRRLGAFFDRLGFDNLHGLLLMERFKHEPANAQILIDLADVYSRRARQTERSAFSRAQNATEAFTCLEKAQQLNPGDADIAARLKAAAAEMTLLKGSFGKV